tara:strand:- start:40 stop:1128 length:1089 start_codon:yes stop_codon:yes gene_type:complete
MPTKKKLEALKEKRILLEERIKNQNAEFKGKGGSPKQTKRLEEVNKQIAELEKPSGATFKMANDKVTYMAKVAGNPSIEMNPEDKVMASDPDGYYMDFKVPTPGYLKRAGYGYNPDQSYGFHFKDKDNKSLRTSEPISDEEFESGGYKLASATYRPIQNQNVDIGSDIDGYNRLKPTTSSMPSGENNVAAQLQANRKNNPYITQITRFDGKGNQAYTTNKVTRGFNKTVSTFDYGKRDSSDPYRTYKGTGATSVFTTRPNESGSNDMNSMTNFTFQNKYDPQTFTATREFRTATSKGLNADFTPRNPNFRVPVISNRFSRSNKQDQRTFSRAMGPGMMNILKGLTYTSPVSGVTTSRFKVKN